MYEPHSKHEKALKLWSSKTLETRQNVKNDRCKTTEMTLTNSACVETETWFATNVHLQTLTTGGCWV
jgi:hypothetical protein